MNFVTGMHDAGVVAATKKTADFFEGEMEFFEEKIGSQVAGSDEFFFTDFPTKVGGFKIKVFGTDRDEVAGVLDVGV